MFDNMDIIIAIIPLILVFGIVILLMKMLMGLHEASDDHEITHGWYNEPSKHSLAASDSLNQLMTMLKEKSDPGHDTTQIQDPGPYGPLMVSVTGYRMENDPERFQRVG